MKSIMQQRLGADWDQLPPALQAHYGAQSIDTGHLSVIFPPWLRPLIIVVSWLGALLNTPGLNLPTQVHKQQSANRQTWRRRIQYPCGKVRIFNSDWQLDAKGRLVEYVNPCLGLQMRPWVEQGRLFYKGEYLVIRLGPLQIRLPQWCGLGNAYVEERAISNTIFAMDFKMVHPLFGQVFRYYGEFQTNILSDST